MIGIVHSHARGTRASAANELAFLACFGSCFGALAGGIPYKRTFPRADKRGNTARNEIRRAAMYNQPLRLRGKWGDLLPSHAEKRSCLKSLEEGSSRAICANAQRCRQLRF